MPRGKTIAPQQIAIIASVVKEGDIICRLGDRLWSQFFSELSLKDKRYSHIGIIHIDNSKVTVINAEGGTEEGKNFVKITALDNFLNVARTAGIYRIKNTDGYKISSMAMEYVGVPFDYEFDISDESKIYCTELLYIILKRLSPELKLGTVFINQLNKEIILPEAISMSENFTEVYFINSR
ncbi:YiiX/YebB-like N1pC/P60 family cysteine hydrolase [Treponema sp. R6D11]